MFIVLVRLQVLGQLSYARCKDRDLDLGGSSITAGMTILLDDSLFLTLAQGHQTPSRHERGSDLRPRQVFILIGIVPQFAILRKQADAMLTHNRWTLEGLMLVPIAGTFSSSAYHPAESVQ